MHEKDSIVEIVEALESTGRAPDSYNLLDYIDVEALDNVLNSLQGEFYITFSVDGVDVEITESGVTATQVGLSRTAQISHEAPAMRGENVTRPPEQATLETKRNACERAISLTQRILPADLVKIAIPQHNQLVPFVSTNDGNVGPKHAVSIDMSIPGQVIASGVSSVIGDLQQTRGASCTTTSTAEQDHRVTRSMLCVPIGDLGVLVAFSYQANAFDDADREMAEDIGKLVLASAHKDTNTAW